jgi:hypothetical protein
MQSPNLESKTKSDKLLLEKIDKEIAIGLMQLDI